MSSGTGAAAAREERGVGLAAAGGVALLPQAGAQSHAGTQQLPRLGREQTVDEGIRGGVEGGHALDEGGHGYGCVTGGVREQAEHLQQIKNDVGRPADDKNKNNDESHLYCLYFCSRNQPSGTGPPGFSFF